MSKQPEKFLEISGEAIAALGLQVRIQFKIFLKFPVGVNLYINLLSINFKNIGLL